LQDVTPGDGSARIRIEAGPVAWQERLPVG
jgi:hypothetical protein